MVWYRLIYKDGRHSAWTRDYAWLRECAYFFEATIESKIFEKDEKKYLTNR